MKLIVDEIIELQSNAMLVARPELIEEWDFEKNNELGLDIYKVSRGNKTKVWWICSKEKCGSSYDSSPGNRIKGHGCPYCIFHKINHTNSFGDLYSELVKEWHPTKNGKISPYNIGYKSSERVWWLGECGHEWEAYVKDRSIGEKGCHYCFGGKVLKGFNDTWTVNPKLAEKLLYPEIGYQYSEGSKIKTDWTCLECGNIIKNQSFMKVKNEGLGCTICSHRTKYPERLMIALLQQLEVSFEHDTSFSWSDKKRYDFYLPEYNMIIESHGEQHYKQGFAGVGGRSLTEEQVNDKYKHEMAKNNGIENYIVIDCRKSKLYFIKDSILNSKLAKVFDLSVVDWDDIDKKLDRTALQELADNWIKYKNLKIVSKLHKLTISKTLEYLERATKLMYCSYNRKEDIYFDKTRFYQLDSKFKIVAEYIQDDEDFDYNTFNMIGVKNACREVGKYKGYYWSMKNKYEKSKAVFHINQINYHKENCVLQIDMNSGIIVKEWIDVHEIVEYNLGYLPATIYNVMHGHSRSYKGFIWIKKKDYSKREINRRLKEIKGSALSKTRYRTVLKIDIKTGEVLEAFNGIGNASKSIGVADNTISKCLNRSKLSSGGFIWIREEDYNTEEGKEYVQYVINRKIELGDNDGMYGRTSHNTKRQI